MPHLQFEMNFAASSSDKSAFAEQVKSLFADIMDTGTDHIGITLRAHNGDDLFFGRALDPAQGIVFLNADIRDGRSAGQKRRLALAIIDELHRRWKVPKESVYIIYTERPGEHFQLSDRILPDWSQGEDPFADGDGCNRP